MELKYKTLPFARLSTGGLLTTVKVIMVKLFVITGWNVPENEFKIILEDQLSKMLVESYPTVNVDEMEYAFRTFPVKDWGKSMNLNLIHEVMTQYMAKRFELSKIEEHRRNQPLLQDSRVTDEEFIESVKSLYVVHQDFKQIPVLAYDCIDLKLTIEKKKAIKETVDGLVSNPTKDHYKQYSVKIYFDELG